MENLKIDLISPSKSYRPLLYWYINDKAENETLMRQLTQFEKAGFGGVILDKPLEEEADAVCREQCEKLNVAFMQSDEISEQTALCGYPFCEYLSRNLCNMDKRRWVFDKDIMCDCLTPDSLKNHIETAFVYGFDKVILPCAYSVKGQNKHIPHYANSAMTHQPHWDSFEGLNRYISRLSMLLSGGQSNAKLLVVQGKRTTALPFAELHTDFDVCRTDEICQRLEQKEYKGIMLCAEEGEIAPDAQAVLQKLYKDGVAVAQFPLLETISFIDDIPLYPGTTEDTMLWLNRNKLREVTVISRYGNEGRIHCRSRDYGDFKVYFMVNTCSVALDTKVYINGENSAVKLRLEDLCENKLSLLDYPQGVAFTLKFEPYQSHVIVVGRKGTLPEGVKAHKAATVITPKQDWEITERDANALVIKGGADGRFTFDIDEAMSLEGCANLRLVVEDSQKYEILVNGKRVFYNGFSWWRDRSFEVIDIKECVMKGENEIVIKGKGCPEGIMLIGDFGVYAPGGFVHSTEGEMVSDGSFILSDAPTHVREGRPVSSGLPFFSGRLLLSQNLKVKKSFGERIYVDFDMPYAASCKLYINSQLVCDLMWRGFPLDITSFAKRGSNTISLELFVPNRNLFEAYDDGRVSFINYGI